jgi:hypothetical protein
MSCIKYETVKPGLARWSRCQVLIAEGKAMESWPDDMPEEAARFEVEGWALRFELAPRCDDRDCWICNG